MPRVSEIESNSPETSTSNKITYDRLQDRYIQLVDNPAALSKLRTQIGEQFKNDPNKPMVPLKDLLEGVRQYSKHLSQNKPPLEELSRIQKLMAFNLEQLKKDPKSSAEAKQALTELHELISERVKTYARS